MAKHFAVASRSRSSMPPDEWLLVNSQITTLVNTWATRDDLVASIGDDAGGATAFFDPARGEIEVNTTVAFGKDYDPSFIGDLNTRKVQFDFPKAAGAIFHEASHAKFTSWDLKEANEELEPRVNQALHLLEEGRIEALGLRFKPENKPLLRSCALGIVLGDMKDEEVQKMSGTRKMAHLAALSLGRVDAGVLTKKDVRSIKAAIDKVIDVDTLRKMQNIWLNFQSIRTPETQIQRMYRLAKQWADLIDEAAKEDDAQEQALADAIGEMMEALGDQIGSTEMDALGDIAEQQMDEKNQADAREKAAKQKEKNSAKDVAKKVMSKKVPESNQSGGQLSYQYSNSALHTRREPTGPERQAALKVSRALEKAKYHDRVRIESNSKIPPGRLNMRAAVQQSAYKAKKMRMETEPWRRVTRKHEVDPNLTVGVMFDISGSMSAAMEPIGVAGWIMSEAVHKIQGKFAMVSYGYDVTPIIKPGQHEHEVSIYSCPDGSEAFQMGFQALDGALDLLDNTGARLLVVVSDGQYKADECDYAVKWLNRCKDAGVAVLWVGYGHSYSAQRYCEQTGAEFILPGATPAEVGKQIGDAATKALEKAGKK